MTASIRYRAIPLTWAILLAVAGCHFKCSKPKPPPPGLCPIGENCTDGICMLSDAGYASDAGTETGTVDAGSPDAGDMDGGVVGDTGPVDAGAGVASGQACSGNSPRPLNVLFIGDSYTATNDLPGMVNALGAAAGTTISVASVIQDGATLQELWGTNAPATIAQGGWTHVVVQGQSEEPCGDPSLFLMYALKFAGAISAAKATPVFFETWPRQAGNSDYSTYPSIGGNPAGMLACLKSSYAMAVQAGGGLLAPAGDAWMAALAQRPGYPFYSSDGSHPNPPGTFLAAAVIFAAMESTTAVGLDSTPAGVTETDVGWLEGVAQETVNP